MGRTLGDLLETQLTFADSNDDFRDANITRTNEKLRKMLTRDSFTVVRGKELTEIDYLKFLDYWNLSSRDREFIELSNYQTKSEANPDVFKKMDDATTRFIEKKEFVQSIEWIHRKAPHFFKDSLFDIKFMPGHDDEDAPILDLRVYSACSLLEFRKQMHAFFEQMLSDDHHNLYDVLSVTHWRRQYHGWQTFLSYSTLPS